MLNQVAMGHMLYTGEPFQSSFSANRMVSSETPKASPK